MEIRLFNEPVIYATHLARTKMDLLIDICSQEVSWLGIVERYEKNVFLIRDIHLLKQECGWANTEIDSMDLQRLWTELRQSGVLSVETQDRVGLYMWGHSHHNMGTSPSSVDEKQMEYFLTSNPPYFIRIIGNKKGEYKTDLYMKDEGIVVFDMDIKPVPEESGDLRQRLEAEVKEKVKPFAYKYSGTGAGAGAGTGTGAAARYPHNHHHSSTRHVRHDPRRYDDYDDLHGFWNGDFEFADSRNAPSRAANTKVVHENSNSPDFAGPHTVESLAKDSGIRVERIGISSRRSR